MVKYNKYILEIEKTNPLLKLEEKYGTIITYNYNDIKKYNDISNHFFENNKSNYIPGKQVKTQIETNTNKISKSKIIDIYYGGKLTLWQRLKQIKIVLIICVGLFIINRFSNILYIWKLNGVIYPILILIVCINIYIITSDYLNSFSNKVSKKKGNMIERINKAIDLFVNAVRDLPGIIPNVPNLPVLKPNNEPFKSIRNGIQKLIINVDIDVNKYKIEIAVPSMAFDFINPLAAICCAWEAFKKLIQPVIDKVIKPFIEVCKKIYKPIKKAITWAKRNIIDPVVTVIMTIYEAITNFINKFVDFFIDVIGAFTWIPGIGDEIQKIIDAHNLQKIQDELKEAEIKNQRDEQKKDHEIDQAAADAAMAQANKDNKSLIAAESGDLNLDDMMERARKFNNMTAEERKALLKNMSAEEREALEKGLKMLKMTPEELKAFCEAEVNKLLPLKKRKLTYINMIPKAVYHVISNPDPRLVSRKQAGGYIWGQKIKNEINLNIYNTTRCSEGCKKTFDIENTTVTGFMRTFHILKKRYKADIKRKNKILFRFKTIKLRNKIKYYKHKCKNYNLSDMGNNLKKCTRNYTNNLINETLKDCKEIIKCSKRVVKLHTIMEMKKKNPKKYNTIINKKNLKFLKENNLQYSSKLIGGWGNPFDILKKAMRALLSPVFDLVDRIKKAFEDLARIISDIPKVLKKVLKAIAKVVNVPQIFKKITGGITFVVNWIIDELPGFFAKILKILENIGILVLWFIKEVISRGIKIIVAIVEFIVELIKTTAKAMNVPSWATTDNPILKIPNVLEQVIKVFDLPFKDVLEALGDTIKGILENIPIDWITDPIDGIKDFAEDLLNTFKAAFNTIMNLVKAAIRGADRAVSFFGKSIYELVPGLEPWVNAPTPDASARNVLLAKLKKQYIDKFHKQLNNYTDEINVLIENRRTHKNNKDQEAFDNATKLLQIKAKKRDEYKAFGIKTIESMKIS